jgi:hypothetical protein
MMIRRERLERVLGSAEAWSETVCESGRDDVVSGDACPRRRKHGRAALNIDRKWWNRQLSHDGSEGRVGGDDSANEAGQQIGDLHSHVKSGQVKSYHMSPTIHSSHATFLGIQLEAMQNRYRHLNAEALSSSNAYQPWSYTVARSYRQRCCAFGIFTTLPSKADDRSSVHIWGGSRPRSCGGNVRERYPVSFIPPLLFRESLGTKCLSRLWCLTLLLLSITLFLYVVSTNS